MSDDAGVDLRRFADLDTDVYVRWHDGLSFGRIASLLGISKSAAYRAFKRRQKLYESWDMPVPLRRGRALEEAKHQNAIAAKAIRQATKVIFYVEGAIGWQWYKGHMRELPVKDGWYIVCKAEPPRRELFWLRHASGPFATEAEAHKAFNDG